MMVERHEQGDPTPKDPWLLRMAINHPQRVWLSLAVVSTVVGASLVISGSYCVRKWKSQYANCMRIKASKIFADMRDMGVSPDVAKELSKNEAAYWCSIFLRMSPHSRTKAVTQASSSTSVPVSLPPASSQSVVTQEVKVDEDTQLRFYWKTIERCYDEGRILVMGYDYAVVCLNRQNVAWTQIDKLPF